MEELELVTRIIFTKVLAEPHHCETYADMVFSLRLRYPEFPPEDEGEPAHTFARVLVGICQDEFDNRPVSVEPTEQEKADTSPEALRLDVAKRKVRMLANVKFIGELFLRGLLAVKVIGQVVADLIGTKDVRPEGYMIECGCELLQAIGHSLDSSKRGNMLMTRFLHRLACLKNAGDPQTGKAV